MKIIISRDTKKIDLDYFSNYGGGNYSETYPFYTISPRKVIDDLINNGVYFETLLEGGCASGELVRDFRNLGVTSYGIENNSDILKKCVVPQYCTQMDLLNIKSIPNNTFDIIYTNALMYINPNKILGVLKEFNRICNKSVYLCNPFLEDCNFKDPYRVFLASRDWWEKQFNQANFKKVSDNIWIKK